MSSLRPLFLILAVLTVAPPAAGQRADAPADELARLRVEHREEQLRARRLRADAEDAAEEVARLDQDLRRLALEDQGDTTAINAQRARLAELGEREAALLARLSGERARQGRLLSSLQMMSREPPPPLLIPADRAVDTVRAAILMQAMAPALRDRADALLEQQVEIQNTRRRAALASEALFTVESAQMNRRAEIETLRGRRRELAVILRADAERAERAARTLEARIETLGGASAPLEPGAARSATAAAPGGRNQLTAPVAGPPSARYSRAARGWTWRADGGAEVRAPMNAVVEHAGPLDGWGEVVILDLSPGWRAVIAGLGPLAVGTGDRVEDGEVLGRLPDSAEAEVYFELRRDNRPVDPSPWLE
ncbi:peptidoglycan DD-metalloendopeptidase family protein [Brevundimonas sp.]|uniref:murein hydrolase activator EnvC family protein n=1 Tax=Brevundimonas sp. TaxID=1871086 RepID=UPI001D613739|nr:peptidoglycan DD-metalloendopeptidase family protein [Brevundimonas sp.]MBA3999504.1 peptidase M23 [Brevundimonas sp.]